MIVRSVVAVDIGKTGARCAAWGDDAATPLADASSVGFPGLAAPGGVAAAARIVTGLVASVSAEQAAVLGVGVPGALAAPQRAQELADTLAQRLPGTRIAVASDAVTAHCGALGGAPGTVAVLGTGVAIVGLGAGGTPTLVDGRGHYVGDAGGGAEIGRLALRAVLRRHDGIGADTVLTAAAQARFGPLDAIAARFADAANPARLAASFAPDVAAGAAAGDPVATAILQAAAADIADGIRVARSASGADLPTAVTGGLLALGEPLLSSVRAGLPGVDLRDPLGDPLAGAARLAGDAATAWEPYVRRAATDGLRAESGRAEDVLDRLRTEQPRPGADLLEQLPTDELVDALVGHDAEAVEALRACGQVLAAVVDAVAERMAGGGRLIYVGAGTPGRLAFLDAAECEPTFGIPPGVVVALIAGGDQAIRRAIEGAEDDAGLGARDVEAVGVTHRDTVVGITASGRTPYVVGAVRAAAAAGALTVGVTNNLGTELARHVELAVEIDSGPEVVAGSTRLAAGTTQKLTLNAVSTGVMVRLGKTYRGRMVDVQATNDKLRTRVVRMVRELADTDEQTALAAVAEAGGDAKTAVVSLRAGISAAQARAALDAAGGRVAQVLDGAPAGGAVP